MSPDPHGPINAEVVPGTTAESRRHSAAPAVHPLSAVFLLIVDNLWTLPEFVVVNWIVTIPLSFFTVALPVFVIQKKLRRDTAARALRHALVLGLVAAVPTSLTGTPVGLAILAWTGIRRWIGPTPEPRGFPKDP
ncbi:MAG TPA: hypothetical protein PKM73_20230 [Verrucomicrobiota bacterium]|nr:hypothetical protein [Verrucomicrobiota bacterium]HNU53187.1 hypothetical protein [Verrucomicrobiota bacterium]